MRIVEAGGIGPVPFAAMMLADHGADVIRIERPGRAASATDVLGRSRRQINLDLKTKEGIETAKRLVKDADGFVEGFRPGTMEKLGLGPDTLRDINPRLVYGRMTGWGQTGPYAGTAGHDLNYIALCGALHAIGRVPGKPVPPLALVGDFGGGGMLLAFAVAAALLRAARTGEGQTIDCAMAEGAGLLMSAFYGLSSAGDWHAERGKNVLDGGAHFYDVYETADGRYVSVGAIEPQFYRELREKLGVADDPTFDAQMDRSRWPELKEKIAAIFKSRTRDEWCRLLENSDVCFAPVLSMTEAPAHPHALHRRSFVTVGGVVQPSPAPHYSVTELSPPRPIETISASDGAWLPRAL
jgi:alpha-methylacyl-CoA racemase